MKMHGISRRVCSLIHPSDHSTLFYSFIYPYLNYCGIVWAATYLSYLNKLLMIQKRFLKTIFHANRFATSAPLFRKYSLLPIDKLNDSQTCLFIFKFLNCKQDLPVTFHNFFPSHLRSTHIQLDIVVIFIYPSAVHLAINITIFYLVLFVLILLFILFLFVFCLFCLSFFCSVFCICFLCIKDT